MSQALLRADCFPAGMELFPAADEEQFDFIKTMIDQSDYYVLITAGRYGSIHPETGLSYTEMEYDYALETKKPIIRLLHQSPFDDLKGEFIEKTAKGKKALEKFRAKLTISSVVKFWATASELKAETLFALQDIQQRKPSTGWVRYSDVKNLQDTESTSLRAELAELKLNTIKSAGNLSVLSEMNQLAVRIQESLDKLALKNHWEFVIGLQNALEFSRDVSTLTSFSWPEAHKCFGEHFDNADEDSNIVSDLLGLLSVYDVVFWDRQSHWKMTDFGEKFDSYISVIDLL